MAQQAGLLRIKGTLDNLTFMQTKEGLQVRRKSGVTASRVATDKAFTRTRENNKEFGTAAKGGKLLRTALRSLHQDASDSRLVGRACKEMMRVVKSDTTHQRGFRTVQDGNLSFLDGFDFNEAAKLSTSLFAPYNSGIDRITGIVTINVPPFVPAQMLNIPPSATHFRINTAGVQLDFTEEKYVIDKQSSPELPISNASTPELTLPHSLPANSLHPLFAVLGIEFFQQVNGVNYPLKSGIYNSLAIIGVDES